MSDVACQQFCDSTEQGQQNIKLCQKQLIYILAKYFLISYLCINRIMSRQSWGKFLENNLKLDIPGHSSTSEKQLLGVQKIIWLSFKHGGKIVRIFCLRVDDRM